MALAWYWIRGGLLEVKAKLGDRAAPWLPEDIYRTVMDKGAVVYVIGQDEGFVVLQKIDSPFETVMFVWVLWAPRGTMMKHSKELMNALEDLARSIGAKTIRMASPREKAWDALNLFVPVSTIYEREVI